jgi:hypothetical protein
MGEYFCNPPIVRSNVTKYLGIKEQQNTDVILKALDLGLHRLKEEVLWK